MAKKIENPLLKIVDKSISDLKANSEAVEKAIEEFLKQEGVVVSDSEYNEIKQLTDTMNELDDALLTLTASKPKSKPKTKKRKTKRRK